MKSLKKTLSMVIIGVSLLAAVPVIAQSADSTRTTTTEHSTTNHDDTGKWGLLGLLGLAGLLGLRRKDDHVHNKNVSR